ncbi:Uncharacterized conserved protein YciI, contains a putative active-site phosphohistidine [Oceanobacillus limi]|uniref:Uncharacterized conserved protein YciI, contains a putative active-site phosphohistidine n=1 Tax=Oceanobacillus limi TaxID=930131 RepID=A0A1H9XZI0_9BACI|nr:YciI family protein [Oceanobacillus limi]SES61736.1 Uncharacterized conserved protein YciI, contains a putative active-site phosphohistidine [Oceanobacillus limi]
MKNYLVTYKDKTKGELSEDLLNRHVDYLKLLSKSGSLKLCGPFTENDRAMMIFQSHSLEEVTALVSKDPFMEEAYYQSYEIKEFFEANEANNWLIDIPQTKSNLME